MTVNNTKLNLLIAELGGWKELPQHEFVKVYQPWQAKVYSSKYKHIRNYGASLDACAEFEKSLTALQKLKFAFVLCSVVGSQGMQHGMLVEDVNRIAFATPIQRCLAYIRTVAPEREKEIYD
jgi:hypothetical protein